MAMATERDAAMRQLDAALDEQARLSEDWRAEIGTPNEIGAYARLRVTSEEISALRGWLARTDEDSGGGRVWLNGREMGRSGHRYPGLEDSHD